MLSDYSDPLERLIKAFKRLPGIGEKTAQRLTFYLLSTDREIAKELSDAVRDVRENIKYCTVCNNFTVQNPCRVCSDESRDSSIICVVEQPGDVVAVENTGEYKGLYHVLMGVLSPIKGVGPQDIAISSLVNRIKEKNVEEIIAATNPTVEGETTAAYLASILKPMGVKVTRIAMGMPVGGDIEFVDKVTIAMAMEGRSEL